MPKYENHRTGEGLAKLLRAIEDYKQGSMTQKEICEKHDIKFSVFSNYYLKGNTGGLLNSIKEIEPINRKQEGGDKIRSLGIMQYKTNNRTQSALSKAIEAVSINSEAYYSEKPKENVQKVSKKRAIKVFDDAQYMEDRKSYIK